MNGSCHSLSFLNSNEIFELFYLGFRAVHSTETALLKLTDDLLLPLDSGDNAVLILLDLLFRCCLVDRTFCMPIVCITPCPFVLWGPSGLYPGPSPLLFISASIGSISSHIISFHFYADEDSRKSQDFLLS